VINFPSYLSPLKINQSSIFKYINHLLFILFSFALLLVSCSSTKRFPNDESTVTIDRTPNINYSSVRVLLDESDAIYHLTIQSPVYLYNGEERLAYIESGNTVECISDYSEVRLTIRDKVFSADDFLLKPAENLNTVKFNGQDYKGKLKLIKLGRSIGIINQLNLEDYVKGVVAREMPIGKDSENFEALKAFSVCVRTYTLKKMSEGKSLYDLYDDTRDQVYGGLDAEHPLSNKAVEETENKILMYNGNIATIYYHSTCGGQTEAAHNIFTKKEIPYMMGIKDGNLSYCNISPKFEWNETYNLEDIIKRLKRASVLNNSNYRLNNVYIESRFSSGRVREMVFEVVDEFGEGKNVSIFGNEIRSIIRTANNKRILWSTFFDVSVNRHSVEITGKGFGHGVGMCQWGAISLSRKGWEYDEIIEHYFPGIKINRLND
jgi:stage II sporulation protein D